MEKLRRKKKEYKAILRKQVEGVKEIRVRAKQYEHRLGLDKLPERDIESLEAIYLLALDKTKQAKARLKVDIAIGRLKEKLKEYISEEEVNEMVETAVSGSATPASEVPETQVPEPEPLEVLESPWSLSSLSYMS